MFLPLINSESLTSVKILNSPFIVQVEGENPLINLLLLLLRSKYIFTINDEKYWNQLDRR